MENEGFQELVEAHQTQVYNLALRMLRDPHGAEDAAQETFVSAYRAFGGFRGENPRAWLLRIATNVCYDMLRRAARRRSVSLDTSASEDGDPAPYGGAASARWQVPDPGRGPEEEALAAERERVLSGLLMELAPEFRAVLVLSDVQGLSYEEIAAATGVGLGTVKSRLSRGRARMRELLREHGELFPSVERLQK